MRSEVEIKEAINEAKKATEYADSLSTDNILVRIATLEWVLGLRNREEIKDVIKNTVIRKLKDQKLLFKKPVPEKGIREFNLTSKMGSRRSRNVPNLIEVQLRNFSCQLLRGNSSSLIHAALS